MAKRTSARGSRRQSPRLTPPGPPDAAMDTYAAVCEALVVYAAPTEADDGRAQAIAERAVRESLGEGWKVTPLGPGARDYRVTRTSGASIQTGRAWTLVRTLQQHRDIADAEPAIVQPGLEPPPGLVEDVPAGVRVRDFSAEPPLPCAATDHEWSLGLCKVKQAWALPPPTSAGRTHGEGIVVGHPDTGYTAHAEIWDTVPRVRVADSYDFVRRQPDARDPLEEGNPGHGTTTASVIMSSTGGAAAPFVSGIAPAAAIVPLRVTPRVVLLGFDRLAEAIHYAVDKGCHVISMSLGGPAPSRALERAIDRAVQHGVVVLAAAGNVWPFVVYPARYDQVIACAACNCQRKIWRQSASGAAVDVTAPGESVWVARPGRDPGQADDIVDVGSGTSYAVATTAGACALWLAFHGRDALVARYGAAQVAAVFKELLMAQGVDTPAGWKRDRHGAGILNVEKLLSAQLPATPPAVGVRVRAALAPRAENDVDRFVEYFPDVDPSRVREGLVRLLKTTDRDLPLVLAGMGDELLFHVATNPAVRARVVKRGGPKKRGRAITSRATTAAAAATASAREQRESSAALRRLLR